MKEEKPAAKSSKFLFLQISKSPALRSKT